MSTSIMSNCWPIRDLSPAQKSVLISLADNANDDGVCWPSVAKIAIRTCLSERAVQAAIRSLMDRGFLTSNQRSGRSTVYTINHRAICTPADAAPPQEIHPTPAGDAPPPPQMLHPTPADAAPRTVKEPSVEPKEKRQKAKSLYSFDQMMAIAPEGLSESVARDYFESRKRKEPLTETAWKRLVTELEKCRAAGYSPDDALGECLVAGWKAVKLEWLASRAAAQQEAQEILVNELLIGSGITERFRAATFDTFMARDQQQASALLTCEEYAATFPAKYQAGQCLLMLGNVGTGKTHLASAITQAVIREHRAQAVIVAASAIFRAVKTTMGKTARYTEEDVLEELGGLDLLVIDEVGASRGSDWEVQLLHEVIDKRYQAVRPTIVVSNLLTKDLKEYIGERAMDRLRQGGGDLIGFTWASVRRATP